MQKWLTGILAALTLLAAPANIVSADEPANPISGLCAAGPRENCVVDGDTFWLGHEKFRIANIDAPELSEPRCSAEKRLAERATIRLVELLAGQDIAIDRQGLDKYGRTLALVAAHGRDVGDVLVAEGLARVWTGRRLPWCR